MDDRKKAILATLKDLYPDAVIELNYQGVWQLLVAVVLSAQCTDKRVNMVTPKLFARLPRVEDFYDCEVERLEKLIFSTGFYRSKAKNLKKAARLIVEEYNGKVPDKMEDLLRLGGVARKTANVVMYAGFGKAEGVVVDTHVMRLARLLRLISEKIAASKNAVKIEKSLMKVLPKSEWGGFSYLLILHGRRTCVARRPQCGACELRELCPSALDL